MDALSGYTHLTYKDMPHPNMWNWAYLCRHIYNGLANVYQGKVTYAEGGERKMREGITRVREAVSDAKKYNAEVEKQKS
jgi:hypothetical protein